MRILVVDDRQVDRRIGARAAAEFGEVREASSLEAARSVLASGWRPVVVLADLHMGGRDPIDSMAELVDAVDAQQTIVIGLTSDLDDVDLVRRFRAAFPSVRLLPKDARAIRRALEGIRLDPPELPVGEPAPCMEASSDAFMAAIRRYEAERLAELGLTWFDLRIWARERLRCISARERIFWAVGLAVVTAVAVTIVGWAGWTLWQAAIQKAVQP